MVNQYLTQLQSLSKRITPTKNAQVGDVECVLGQNLPPNRWSLADVIKACTTECTDKRPITKLVPLLAEDKNS